MVIVKMPDHSLTACADEQKEKTDSTPLGVDLRSGRGGMAEGQAPPATSLHTQVE